MDDIFPGEDQYNYIKALLQKKATEKWYRAVRIKNLTEGSEAYSALRRTSIGTLSMAPTAG